MNTDTDVGATSTITSASVPAQTNTTLTNTSISNTSPLGTGTVTAGGAVSAATNAANVASASNLVEINLGLDQIPQSQWTQAQMISYLQGLSAMIIANPSEFTAQELASAQQISGSNLNSLQLQDSSISLSDIGTALESSASAAGTSLVNLGNGISNVISSTGDALTKLGNAASNTASVAEIAIPAILIIGVILLFQTKSASVSKKGFSYARSKN
jgi:hypothetical protein